MSKIYYQERNHPNWTGRVPRQARITGQWSSNRKDDKIPLKGYIVGVFALLTFWLANFL